MNKRDCCSHSCEKKNLFHTFKISMEKFDLYFFLSLTHAQYLFQIIFCFTCILIYKYCPREITYKEGRLEIFSLYACNFRFLLYVFYRTVILILNLLS